MHDRMMAEVPRDTIEENGNFKEHVYPSSSVHVRDFWGNLKPYVEG